MHFLPLHPYLFLPLSSRCPKTCGIHQPGIFTAPKGLSKMSTRLRPASAFITLFVFHRCNNNKHNRLDLNGSKRKTNTSHLYCLFTPEQLGALWWMYVSIFFLFVCFFDEKVWLIFRPHYSNAKSLFCVVAIVEGSDIPRSRSVEKLTYY